MINESNQRGVVIAFQAPYVWLSESISSPTDQISSRSLHFSLTPVINTLISTIFALTLCLMTVLSNFDSSFWYFDPVLSIVLALFMAGFGLKVIHQNFHILRPGHYSPANIFGSPLAKLPLISRNNSECAGRSQYETNLTSSMDGGRANWQKTDCTAVAFV
jgi:hypothetical protein